MITTDWTMIGAVAQVFAVMVSIIGFFFLTWQVRISSKVARADFVMRLESEYVNHHLVVYQKFLSKYNDHLHCVEVSLLLNNEVETSEIEHYLVFFEIIEVLLSEKLIDIKIIDKMFAYRFFIVVNNPYVRELIEQDKAYWELLFTLYHDWVKWRKVHGKPIPNSEFPLVDSVA